MIDKKQPENVVYSNHLGSLITNDARRTREIKSRITVPKTAFNMEKTLFTSKLDFNLRNKPVTRCIGNITLYGAETWTLRKVDKKYLGSYKNVMLQTDGDQSD